MHAKGLLRATGKRVLLKTASAISETNQQGYKAFITMLNRLSTFRPLAILLLYSGWSGVKEGTLTQLL